jgi:hypothetical protein
VLGDVIVRLSESNLVFPGFLLVCLYELLECLGDNIAEQAGIGRDDRHHRLNHLLWIMPFALLPKKGKIVLDVRSLDEVPVSSLPVKGRLGHRFIEPGQEGLRIDGLYLDLEWLQFSLKRLGDALQSMLARGIGG